MPEEIKNGVTDPGEGGEDGYITGITTPDGEPAYDIPTFSRFDEAIRALQDTDPARASTVFNPLVQKLIDNIYYVRNQTNLNRTLIDGIEPYDDTALLAEVDALRQYIDEYKYDDTELQALVTELQNEVLTVTTAGVDLERRLNGVAGDLADLAFELAMNGLIDTGGMQNVVVDKIESQDDVILLRGQYANKKVFI